MKHKLTPVLRGSGVEIFSDIYGDGPDQPVLTAMPVTYRRTNIYEQDQPGDPYRGPILTMTSDEAKEFASEILKLMPKGD